MLKFNGIYWSREKENTGSLQNFSYIRFYEDGLVITVNSTEHKESVIGWLEKEERKPKINKGKFILEGDRVRFYIETMDGVIEYEGRILKRYLDIEGYYHISDKRFQKRYLFYEISLIYQFGKVIHIIDNENNIFEVKCRDKLIRKCSFDKFHAYNNPNLTVNLGELVEIEPLPENPAKEGIITKIFTESDINKIKESKLANKIRETLGLKSWEKFLDNLK